MMISQDPILYSSLGVGDTIVLFLLALVVFGPKRLPEIGRQIGKIYGEFRRASNEFKFQIEDELRKAEETEKQKKLEAEPAAAQMPAAPQILPPSTGQIIAQRESSLHENPLPIGESVEEPRVAGDNLETVRTHEEVQR
jgi:sec-independent protein translocase protein TatB